MPEVRAHFVNENIAGHRTMHLGLRRHLPEHSDISFSIYDCPERSLLVRLAGRRLPGLDALDMDYSAVRDQMARSLSVRAHLWRISPPDVLHLYTQNIGLASTEYMARVPTIVSTDTTNTLFTHLEPWGRARRIARGPLAAARRLEKRVFDAAAMVVTHSEWAAASVRESGVSPEKVRVIPFGIVMPDSAPRHPEDRPRITFIGNSMGNKGGWQLLDLWRRYLRSHSTLTFVTYDRVPAEEGVEVRNDVRPGNGKLWEILARTDVLAHTSTVDPFGYAVIEAMAAGVPVVAVAAAARPELVEDGVTGLLYRPYQDDGLRDALEAIVSDRDAAATMGRAARQRAETLFDARVTTGQLVSLVRAVRGDGRARGTGA
ncbi:MAG TPA: glycosyltransferase family 4 protein [Acidimicrobiales bacterium]|nr:glycosyltransferase family 4 protein [Acidimicrobiales bacterium]